MQQTHMIKIMGIPEEDWNGVYKNFKKLLDIRPGGSTTWRMVVDKLVRSKVMNNENSEKEAQLTLKRVEWLDSGQAYKDLKETRKIYANSPTPEHLEDQNEIEHYVEEAEKYYKSQENWAKKVLLQVENEKINQKIEDMTLSFEEKKAKLVQKRTGNTKKIRQYETKINEKKGKCTHNK